MIGRIAIALIDIWQLAVGAMIKCLAILMFGLAVLVVVMVACYLVLIIVVIVAGCWCVRRVAVGPATDAWQWPDDDWY